MKYRLIHRTKYSYAGAVTVSHHLARLAPRTLPGQRCPWHELEILPTPVGRGVHVDSFGNVAAYFEVEGKHESLEVIARSLVEVFPTRHPEPATTPPWEQIRDACQVEKLAPCSEAGAFRFGSPMVPLGKEFADFAIEDLRKWGRWELTETILKTAALDTHKKEPMVKRAVLKFMLAASEKNPKAAEFIAVARKDNPEKIKEYEEILEQERKTAAEAAVPAAATTKKKPSDGGQ